MRPEKRVAKCRPEFSRIATRGSCRYHRLAYSFDPHVHVSSLPATNCISLADFIRLIRASRYRNYGRGNASRNSCKPENLCRHPPPPPCRSTFQFFSPSLLLPFYTCFLFFFSRVSLSATVVDLQIQRYYYNIFNSTFLRIIYRSRDRSGVGF